MPLTPTHDAQASSLAIDPAILERVRTLLVPHGYTVMRNNNHSTSRGDKPWIVSGRGEFDLSKHDSEEEALQAAFSDFLHNRSLTGARMADILRSNQNGDHFSLTIHPWDINGPQWDEGIIEGYNVDLQVKHEEYGPDHRPDFESFDSFEILIENSHNPSDPHPRNPIDEAINRTWLKVHGLPDPRKQVTA